MDYYGEFNFRPCTLSVSIPNRGTCATKLHLKQLILKPTYPIYSVPNSVSSYTKCVFSFLVVRLTIMRT